MMRALLLVGLLFLGGCDSARVSDCEAQLKERLKAPASYKRVKVEETALEPTGKEATDQVTITYDAVNSYNAPLRDEEVCYYKPGTTIRMLDPFFDSNAAAVDLNVEASADAALNAAAEELNRGSEAIANANAELAADQAPDADEGAAETEPFYDVNNDAGE